MKKWLPLIFVVVMAAWFAGDLRPKKDKDFAYSEFGKLPVVSNGRIQPLDSLARNSLLELREKQTLNLEPWKDWNEKPKIIPAIEWLATVAMKPELADTWPVFRVDHPELIAMLKLPEKDKAKQVDGKHYSWSQIQPALGVMDEQSKHIMERERRKETEPDHRTPIERAVMKMHARLVTYMKLRLLIQPHNTENFVRELDVYEKAVGPGVAAIRAQEGGQSFDKDALDTLSNLAERYIAMQRFEPPLILPPASAEAANTEWKRVGDALMEVLHEKPLHPAVRRFAAISDAYRTGNVPGFNQAVTDYRTSLSEGYAKQLSKASREQFFNRAEFFYHAMVTYVLAFVLVCLFWGSLSDWLRKSAVGLILLAFVIHTVGLIFRMVLEGRPPVTNLYSSAIFIGFGAVVLGMVLEKVFKDGIGACVAAAVGFTTLVIAHNLAIGGDTMEMMRAVLDTNFWLATHVVVVTLGYASTFVAGFLAMVYVILGVFTPRLTMSMVSTEKSEPLGPIGNLAIGTATVAAAVATGGLVIGMGVAPKVGKMLQDAASNPSSGPIETTNKVFSRMVYGIVCFATLFSFVGTVLGGIWADQSWGRFWGWDPKENGALIIVLWNALILHARWGGLVKERGLMNLALVGNIVTAWSWFGVNMLGIGLHSYGFMDAAFQWLMIFIGSQLFLIGLGLLPKHLWKSYRVSAAVSNSGSGSATAPAAS